MNLEKFTVSQLASPKSHPPTAKSYWVLPGKLLAGAFPGDADPARHRKQVRTLVDAGIRTFVNLMEPDETNYAGEPFALYDSVARALAADCDCVRLSIPDLSIPTATQAEEILATIDSALTRQSGVYVHCWGGVGRTGTIIGCWLLRHGLANSLTVLETLATLRKQDRERGHRRSPETDEQRDFVLDWLKP